MRGTVLYGSGDIRFEERETPKIIEATDAVIRMAATCVCGRIFGRTVACSRLKGRRQWATNTAVSSKKWAARSGL
jgi:hypothetical protein